MSASQNNQIKNIGKIFDDTDKKFIKIPKESIVKIEDLPERKEAKEWPKVTL